MKILVPIDFSLASDWGFYYAYGMAKMLGAELHAVHLYRPAYVESTMPERVIKSIKQEREIELAGHLQANTQAPLGEPAGLVKIHRLLISANEQDLYEVATEQRADLIIMGTHGADGALDRLFGTNTSKLIEQAPCPLIAVPKGAYFKGFKSIAYALSLENQDLDNVQSLRSLAQLTQAKLACIRINVLGEEQEIQAQETHFRTAFSQRFDDAPEVQWHTRSSTSIVDGLESFLRFNQIDVLALQPRKRGVLEKLFGDPSVTREMVLRAKLPILAFKS